MPLWGIWTIYLGAFLIFIILHALSKNKKPVKRAFLSAITGICTLIAVNICGIFTGVTLPVSLLSVTVSFIGGIPGVTLLLALNMIV